MCFASHLGGFLSFRRVIVGDKNRQITLTYSRSISLLDEPTQARISPYSIQLDLMKEAA